MKLSKLWEKTIYLVVHLTCKEGEPFSVHISHVFADNSIKRESSIAHHNWVKRVKLAEWLHKITSLRHCGEPDEIVAIR